MIVLVRASLLPKHSLPAGYFPERDEKAAIVCNDATHHTAHYPFLGGGGVRVPLHGGFFDGPILAHNHKIDRGSDGA